MPISINLLAEAQAAEDLRRRDPVKRAIYCALGLVLIVGFWISSLQVRIMTENSGLGSLQSRLGSRTNQYTKIIQNKQRLQEINSKLTALNHLAAHRFLLGTLLDAPMHAPVDGIQFLRLHTEQAYEEVTPVQAVVEHGKTIVAGRTAASIEKVKLVLDAKDSSINPGNEQISKFKEALAKTPYFQAEQITTNHIMLKNLSQPQVDPDSGKTYVLFSLECQYPEKNHSL
jgi:hypothetical protein